MLPTELTRRRFHKATLGLIAAGWPATRADGSPSILSEPAGKPILLNNNENPYGPSPAALEAIRRFATAGNRYPDRTEENLIRAVARANRVATEHVIVSNGSTELLRMAVTYAGLRTRQLILPHPTFEAIASYADPLGISIQRVPLKSDGKHDLEAMRRAVGKTGAVVYICNPNNPTGGFTPDRELAPFIRALPASAFIVVDEAYHEFVDAPDYHTWIHEGPSYPNLLVCRTFSKIYGLAGMRIGYGVGNARVIAELSRFRNQDCINVCGGEAAQAALTDRKFVRMCHDQNWQERDRLAELCRQLGRKYLPSVANFMVVEAGDAKKFREFMASHGIEVGRPFQTLEKFSRISIGTPREMGRFAEVYRQWRIY